jgi:hypothetical protein
MSCPEPRAGRYSGPSDGCCAGDGIPVSPHRPGAGPGLISGNRGATFAAGCRYPVHKRALVASACRLLAHRARPYGSHALTLRRKAGRRGRSQR